MSFATGEIVGQYKIMERLGRGGMATVYKAYHSLLDRYVAVKVMDSTLSKERGFIERFNREARVIAKLDNPHIVPVYDFNEHQGQPYLVLKYIDGQTLIESINRTTLSRVEILDYVLAVGNALQYAHDRKILHRDVKPSNVLIASSGQTYLTDFGLARLVEGGSTLTGDMIVGTPQYISPEQARNTEKLDEGTDIYSFGVMIYEMVTGRVPFDAETVFSIIEDHVHTPPPPPSFFKPDLSPDVEYVILKALAKKRSERYDKVSTLVSAFKKAWTSKTDRKKTITSSTLDSILGVATLFAENGKSFPLVSAKMVIGRDSFRKGIVNDIDLTDLDVTKIVSRRHAMIQRQNDTYVLHDLNSTNGVLVNGERISPRLPHVLKVEDVVEFGTGGVKLTFRR